MANFPRGKTPLANSISYISMGDHMFSKSWGYAIRALVRLAETYDIYRDRGAVMNEMQLFALTVGGNSAGQWCRQLRSLP